MRNRFSIFDYYMVDSDIHRLGSFSKILSILLVIFCIVIADSVVDVFVIGCFIFLVMLWSNISFRFLIKNFSLFKFFIVFVVLVVSLLFFNIYIGVLWGIKVFLVFLYVSIVTMTTTLVDIIYGFERVLSIFSGFINVKSVALRLGLGFKFLSLLYSESDRINRSRMLRGVSYSDMGIGDRIKYFGRDIDCVFRNSYYEVLKINDAMYLENYGISGTRCNYRLNKWKKTDTILLVINVVVMIVTFIY